MRSWSCPIRVATFRALARRISAQTAVGPAILIVLTDSEAGGAYTFLCVGMHVFIMFLPGPSALARPTTADGTRALGVPGRDAGRSSPNSVSIGLVSPDRFAGEGTLATGLLEGEGA